MKRPGIDGGFLLCLGLNMLMNLQWTIPAWLLLIAHFALGTPLWWFVAALALWALILLGISAALTAISRMDSPSQRYQHLSPAEEKARDEDIRKRSANIRNKSN